MCVVLPSFLNVTGIYEVDILVELIMGVYVILVGMMVIGGTANYCSGFSFFVYKTTDDSRYSKDLGMMTKLFAGGFVVFIFAACFVGQPGNPTPLEALSRLYCGTYTLFLLLFTYHFESKHSMDRKNKETQRRVRELEEALNSRGTRS
ncbi:hypothetical protein CO180_02415 [candidate division WWE3 bacterium CG_4_9_14_3_um_filter_41_6]|uniref:Uncharacterized protein n=1 Tax=candidate division WWE3 bacterium CG_4_10_14_0_2_um_filter_41_14 TaxID=1975072 RepID=A0A2M7TJZ9_UNCKA|nr:MAG: hypothetical protein COY32_03115 [candidate division WWE3 bacterium CG_4_10_14_0_2_um_filter_41_14]PJA38810.1 MAG: hypothetical protein CO180_02415 [candidate division WWE3 bacterium CG_4_9_14_3_um_filter_41_6]